MNVQAVPIRQTRRCLLPFCTTCSWDFATGIFHLFLLQRICLGWVMVWNGPGCATGLWHAPACWQGGMAGVPGVLQCLLPVLPAPGKSCFHHLPVWEQKWWKLRTKEQSQEDVELF